MFVRFFFFFFFVCFCGEGPGSREGNLCRSKGMKEKGAGTLRSELNIPPRKGMLRISVGPAAAQLRGRDKLQGGVRPAAEPRRGRAVAKGLPSLLV